MFWLTIFGSSAHRRKKTNYIFWILRKFWVKNKCFLYQIIVWTIWSCYLYIWFIIIWLRLDMTSVKSQIGWCHRVDCRHCRYLRAKGARRHVLHGMFAAFIYTDLAWPYIDFDLFKVWPSYSLSTLLRHLPAFVWVRALCNNNQPESPKCEKAAFWPLTWPWTDTVP